MHPPCFLSAVGRCHLHHHQVHVPAQRRKGFPTCSRRCDPVRRPQQLSWVNPLERSKRKYDFSARVLCSACRGCSHCYVPQLRPKRQPMVVTLGADTVRHKLSFDKSFLKSAQEVAQAKAVEEAIAAEKKRQAREERDRQQVSQTLPRRCTSAVFPSMPTTCNSVVCFSRASLCGHIFDVAVQGIWAVQGCLGALETVHEHVRCNPYAEGAHRKGRDTEDHVRISTT